MKPQELFDKKVAELNNWQGEMLVTLRKVIEASNKNLTMEWKWGTAVWTHNGLVCAISSFKDHVKINFFEGALLPDPQKVFNSGLDSKRHRSINLPENEEVPEAAISGLIQSAVDYNNSK